LIRRSDEVSSAFVSKALVRLSKLTVLTVVKDIAKNEINLIRANY